MPNALPRILLADCDQMFVAVARLVDPEGAGRARLLVVGGAAGSRGVVCSASYEVRVFGVRSGMPIARAARLCPKATFVPVPRQACVTKSRQVRRLLGRWTPAIEAASIDEFYLDLSGTEALYRHAPLEEVAARIREDVLARSGLALSFGGGTNRLVAKLAAERAKPRPGSTGTGVWIVPPGTEAQFLASHRLAEIPGVGPRLQAKLRTVGLDHVRDALAVAERDFESWLGPRAGPWLYRRIRGVGSAVVEPRGEPKSISREETFPVDIRDPDRLDLELLRLTTRLGADLRRDGFQARCVTVKLREDDFLTRQASRTLPAAFRSDRVPLATARELLANLWRRRRRPVRLLGVAFSRLVAGPAASQLDLLADSPEPGLETSRDRAVAGVVDRINDRFGRSAMRPARLVQPPECAVPTSDTEQR
jgi:DNA polymerase-4